MRRQGRKIVPHSDNVYSLFVREGGEYAYYLCLRREGEDDRRCLVARVSELNGLSRYLGLKEKEEKVCGEEERGEPDGGPTGSAEAGNDQSELGDSGSVGGEESQ